MSAQEAPEAMFVFSQQEFQQNADSTIALSSR
jgi:hypothetical protein